jgi:hypothetical protein
MTEPGILDNLELELRMLPGVRAAGFDERDDVLFVQLHLADESGQRPDPMVATRIAARHAAGPVAVEIAHWRALPADATEPETRSEDAAYVDLTLDVPVGEFADLLAADDASSIVHEITAARHAGGSPRATHRPRLLAVLVFPDTDELEVHLMHEGRRTIGRAPASRGLVGAVEATIEAVRGLGASIDPRPKWARAIDSNGDGRELVAVALAHENEVNLHYGLAAGASAIDAAARSTLDALNRQLARVL